MGIGRLLGPNNRYHTAMTRSPHRTPHSPRSRPRKQALAGPASEASKSPHTKPPSSGGKRGRPTKPYVTSWGQTVPGLRRRPTDGRWEITAWWGKGKKFTEEDECRALARFEALKPPGERDAATIALPQQNVDASLVQLGRVTHDRFARLLGHDLLTKVEGRPLEQWQIDGDHATASTQVLQNGVWEHLRRELSTRPDWVAKQVGIPELARLADVAVRPVSPTLRAIGDLYQAHAPSSPAWKRRVARYWIEFRHGVGVERLRQLTPGRVLVYAAKVLSQGKSPTYSRQRFAAIKAVIHLAQRHGLDPVDCRHALDTLAVLRSPRPRKPDPRPVAPEVLRKLMGHADVTMRVALLLGLNCCSYAAEVAALDWADLDLEQRTLTTHRPKTGVLRVAVLWSTTVEALRALPSSRLGQGPALRVTGATVRRRFWDLRQRAGVDPGVCFEHLRDASYTTAVEADGVSLTQAQVLAGHRVGMPDYYLARRPQLVAAACAAVGARFGLA